MDYDILEMLDKLVTQTKVINTALSNFVYEVRTNEITDPTLDHKLIDVGLRLNEIKVKIESEYLRKLL